MEVNVLRPVVAPAPWPRRGVRRQAAKGAKLPAGCTKQTFVGHPTNARLDSFVFAEFFRKTGKATFANSA